ncbi:hypothetical protein JYU34_009176 [Plutella xylostella]|uniref:Centriolar and ciliogenesis-associated protein HYLS1 C-terminal domain-containing protein n=1 Tax=Plutella xylostella TaxID=51655 RepID=A0ABQ7QNA6_PLUXY|nr:hypothetical protein JYU34_009176 [Plutella xylostella]
MEADYYEVTSELDAREILRYLNDLGIHNISGEVLKYFMTDLKKFIKYDLQKKHKSDDKENYEIQGPERLHSASTFCSRIRSKNLEKGKLQCTRECHSTRVQSAPSLSRSAAAAADAPRRSCSCVRMESMPRLATATKTQTTSSTNLIKVSKQPSQKKCDPVALYHYYSAVWERHREQLPGTSRRQDLRWQTRQRMAGMLPKPTTNQMTEKLKVEHKHGKKKP